MTTVVEGFVNPYREPAPKPGPLTFRTHEREHWDKMVLTAVEAGHDNPIGFADDYILARRAREK